MKIKFYKYQAAGNDFVLLDNREKKIILTTEQIGDICHRRFGVGADGVIVVETTDHADFQITYFNPDGSQSLCGNGCRTAVELASRLGLAKAKSTFSAYDGIHQAELLNNGLIRIQMSDVDKVDRIYGGYYMDTGSPHFVKFITGLKNYPVFEEGRKIRYDPYFPKGANANFLEKKDNQTLFLRTYERGVEEETLACGTGATAAAIAASFEGFHSPVILEAKGGTLRVEFKIDSSGRFSDIYLTGPAKLVFQGEMEL